MSENGIELQHEFLFTNNITITPPKLNNMLFWKKMLDENEKIF